MKERLLSIAVDYAARYGIEKVTRDVVADVAEVSTGSVSYYFGDMRKLRAEVVKRAIETENLNVIAQAVAMRHPKTVNMNDQLRRRAVQSLAR